MGITYFLSVEGATIIGAKEAGTNIYFFKKRVMYELRGINQVQWKTHRRWVDNVEVIDCKNA